MGQERRQRFFAELLGHRFKPAAGQFITANQGPIHMNPAGALAGHESFGGQSFEEFLHGGKGRRPTLVYDVKEEMGKTGR